MPLKVQFPLPTIGLQLYQLGVHIRANKKILVLCYNTSKQENYKIRNLIGTVGPLLTESGIDRMGFRSTFTESI